VDEASIGLKTFVIPAAGALLPLYSANCPTTAQRDKIARLSSGALDRSGLETFLAWCRDGPMNVDLWIERHVDGQGVLAAP
jgi:hypothetical protein